METTINLDRVRPERVAGYGLNFVGDGWVERVKGKLLRKRTLRGTVVLNDDDARKAIDFMAEHENHPYPFSFTDNNRIVGVEVVESDLVQSGQPR
jgi:hypothetical protein